MGCKHCSTSLGGDGPPKHCPVCIDKLVIQNCPRCGKEPVRNCWGTGASYACPDAWGRLDQIKCDMKTKTYFQFDRGDGTTYNPVHAALWEWENLSLTDEERAQPVDKQAVFDSQCQENSRNVDESNMHPLMIRKEILDLSSQLAALTKQRSELLEYIEGDAALPCIAPNFGLPQCVETPEVAMCRPCQARALIASAKEGE